MERRPAPTVAWRGTLRLEAGLWHIQLEGHSVIVQNLLGMRYIAALLSRPDHDIHATELSAAALGGGPVEHGRANALTTDDQARAGYRRRLDELDYELDGAD